MTNLIENKSSAGKRNDAIRSDCYVEVEKIKTDGIMLNLESKVASLYGTSIQTLIKDICRVLEVTSIKISINDYGALPFVIAARVECALKRLFPEITTNYQNFTLTPNDITHPISTKRRSRLYLPGNEPKYLLNASLHKPDAIILDLEDSVAQDEKDAARILVRNALMAIDFSNCERMVRINASDRGIEDLEAVIPYPVETILVPKCETSEDILSVEKSIAEIQRKKNRTRPVFILPIIETAKGVLNAHSIVKASNSVCAVAIGLEDYCADIGVERTLEGKESLFARQMVINSAKAVGIQVLAGVYSDVGDEYGLLQSVLEAKSIGFDGMGCIHPRQIRIIHEGFAPTEDEIRKAKNIILAFEKAKQNKTGITSLGTKMIDAPVVKRAQRIIDCAIESGKVETNWITDYTK